MTRPSWADALDPAALAVGPDDPFTILYTSGTTSFPKGAVISHRNCVPHGWWCGEVLRLTTDDRVLHALPLSGTWGGLCIPLAAFSHGAALILMETFEPAVALRLMETERVTVWNGVDAMAIPMLEHPDLARRDRSHLRTGGFAATGGGVQGLFEAVVERLGVRQAFQPYGMTEVNAHGAGARSRRAAREPRARRRVARRRHRGARGGPGDRAGPAAWTTKASCGCAAGW